MSAARVLVELTVGELLEHVGDVAAADLGLGRIEKAQVER